jgi:hypothetical protein
LADYQAHRGDTHTWIDAFEDKVEYHIFPGIVAKVVFDRDKRVWVMFGDGVVTKDLALSNPDAPDYDIAAEVSLGEIVYKVEIVR